ncbi:MAG: TonB-dependent receptor [Pseudomonadales bacterium]|nr:TonB-dependent receptor [Pseudomonadales bacterium]
MVVTRYFQILIPLMLVGSPLTVLAQTSPLEEIVVIGSRTEQALGNIPMAISIVGQDDIQLGRQELSLDESLARIPGLTMQNRYNFTQDLNVSIRGFGARASFGIRGIKVFSDDIPVTLPDGQSGTDDLDLGSAQSIEVIRGPSASLYGTASGGVISLTTQDPTPEPFVETKFTFGEFGQEKYQVKAGGESGRFGYLVNISHLEMDGFRDFSGVQHSLINSKLRYTFADDSTLTAIINAVNSPFARDPGGITRAEVAADRKQAQSRNLSSNSGESFNQQRVGLVYKKNFGTQHALTLRTYSIMKDFKTFLPIGTHIPFVADDGVAQFDRTFYGAGALYTYSDTLLGLPNVFSIGVDVDVQRDDRQRFLNNAGVQGAKVFDQLEEADSLGVYFRNETNLTDRLILSFGGRYDNLDLSVNDRYIANGDQSGDLDFDEFSPSIGLMWNLSPALNLYTNFATSFETPTFTELGSPAQDLNVNLGGFNNVNAQEADSFEIGAKGSLLNNRLFYDLALYTMDVDDEISNIVSIENRAFFENSDTDRSGLELQIQAQLTDRLKLTAAYTYSDFTFDSFDTNPAAVDERIPGIPKHQLYAELAYRHTSGTYLILDALNVGDFYSDNANTDAGKVDSTIVSNLRLGRDFAFNDITVAPFFGVNNLFDEDYFSNVRTNAFGGRAFEPAPDRHIYGGVRVNF